MTLALAIIIPLSMPIYSNSRITEAKETLRAEMATGNNRVTEAKETLRAEMQALRMEMKAGFEKISSEIRDVRNDLKIHELEHHK